MSKPEPWEGVMISALAGAATVLGGLSLFVVRRFKPVPFSIALGLAGGAMTYVTMVEMIPEAMHGCTNGLIMLESKKAMPRSDVSMEAMGWLIGTTCVFSGWLIGWILSSGLDSLLDHFTLIGDMQFDSDGNLKTNKKIEIEVDLDDEIEPSPSVSNASSEELMEIDADVSTLASLPAMPELTHSQGLELVKDFELVQFYNSHGHWDGNKAMKSLIDNESGSFTQFLLKRKGCIDQSEYTMIRMANSAFKHDQKKFLRIGIFTAVALGIHNLPEGMATYTSYMEDKSFGYGMAFAIAIHNIPEGIAVAIPVYFGTGSWINALSLCFISAIAEPFGAVIAMRLKSYIDSPMLDGVMFGMISGFMLRVALSELFFTAFKYDSTNIVAVKSVCLGMAIMAYSLVLFRIFA